MEIKNNLNYTDDGQLIIGTTPTGNVKVEVSDQIKQALEELKDICPEDISDLKRDFLIPHKKETYEDRKNGY